MRASIGNGLALLVMASSPLMHRVDAFTNRPSSSHHRTDGSCALRFANRHRCPAIGRPISIGLYAIPDVSSLPQYSEAAFATSTTSSSASPISPQILATASAAVTYLSLILYFDRPRGSLAIPDAESTLIIQPSRVPGAGLGLFAATSLPKGTVLGTYPGVLRPARAFYDGKCRRYPNAVGYSWRFTDDQYVLDPTDSAGEIRDICLGGSEVPLSNTVFASLLRFLGVSTMLCRINEPPIGAGGCSVNARENLATREVVFELVQDVVTGQELYLDYGLDYDRTGYRPPPENADDGR